jgi:hypothetical protein
MCCVTHTPAGDFDDNTVPFRVVREPKLIELYGLFRDSDVVHVAGPALAPLGRTVGSEAHRRRAPRISDNLPERPACHGAFWCSVPRAASSIAVPRRFRPSLPLSTTQGCCSSSNGHQVPAFQCFLQRFCDKSIVGEHYYVLLAGGE